MPLSSPHFQFTLLLTIVESYLNARILPFAYRRTWKVLPSATVSPKVSTHSMWLLVPTNLSVMSANMYKPLSPNRTTSLTVTMSSPFVANASTVLYTSSCVPSIATLVTYTEMFAVLPFAVVAVTTTLPSATPVSTPFLSTVAILSLSVVHVTVLSVAFSGATVAAKVTVPFIATCFAPLTSTLSASTITLTVTVAFAPCPSLAVAVITASPALCASSLPRATSTTSLSELVHSMVLSVALSGNTVATSVATSFTLRVSVCSPSMVMLLTATSLSIVPFSLYPHVLQVRFFAPSATYVGAVTSVHSPKS